MVMFGNGVKIGMEITVALRRPIQEAQNQVISVWLVEAVGSTCYIMVVLQCVVDTVLVYEIQQWDSVCVVLQLVVVLRNRRMDGTRTGPVRTVN